MAHEIAYINGQASMAYVGPKPWHGLGQELTPNSPIEIWLQQSGMAFDVLRQPVSYTTPNGIMVFEDKHTLYRSDNYAPLAVVSDSYKIVQPKEVLEFYRDLCDQFGFQLETAGVLFEGRKLWALAKTPLNLTLRGGDAVNGYLLLATSNDGSLATTAKFTTIRVVCNNTLSMASKDGSKHELKVSHRSVFNADKVKQELGIVRNSWDEMEDIFRELSNRKVSSAETGQLILDVFKVNPDSRTIEDESTRSKNIMQEVFQSVRSSPGSNLLSADGTAWGLLNGITHYIDHKGGARNDENRLNTAWFGKGEGIKDKAFQAVLKLVA